MILSNAENIFCSERLQVDEDYTIYPEQGDKEVATMPTAEEKFNTINVTSKTYDHCKPFSPISPVYSFFALDFFNTLLNERDGLPTTKNYTENMEKFAKVAVPRVDEFIKLATTEYKKGPEQGMPGKSVFHALTVTKNSKQRENYVSQAQLLHKNFFGTNKNEESIDQKGTNTPVGNTDYAKAFASELSDATRIQPLTQEMIADYFINSLQISPKSFENISNPSLSLSAGNIGSIGGDSNLLASYSIARGFLENITGDRKTFDEIFGKYHSIMQDLKLLCERFFALQGVHASITVSSEQITKGLNNCPQSNAKDEIIFELESLSKKEIPLSQLVRITSRYSLDQETKKALTSIFRNAISSSDQHKLSVNEAVSTGKFFDPGQTLHQESQFFDKLQVLFGTVSGNAYPQLGINFLINDENYTQIFRKSFYAIEEQIGKLCSKVAGFYPQHGIQRFLFETMGNVIEQKISIPKIIFETAKEKGTFGKKKADSKIIEDLTQVAISDWYSSHKGCFLDLFKLVVSELTVRLLTAKNLLDEKITMPNFVQRSPDESIKWRLINYAPNFQVENQSISFQSGRLLNIILGSNGSGKTYSATKAIYAFLGAKLLGAIPADRNSFIPLIHYFVKSPENFGRLSSEFGLSGNQAEGMCTKIVTNTEPSGEKGYIVILLDEYGGKTLKTVAISKAGDFANEAIQRPYGIYFITCQDHAVAKTMASVGTDHASLTERALVLQSNERMHPKSKVAGGGSIFDSSNFQNLKYSITQEQLPGVRNAIKNYNMGIGSMSCLEVKQDSTRFPLLCTGSIQSSLKKFEAEKIPGSSPLTVVPYTSGSVILSNDSLSLSPLFVKIGDHGMGILSLTLVKKGQGNEFAIKIDPKKSLICTNAHTLKLHFPFKSIKIGNASPYADIAGNDNGNTIAYDSLISDKAKETFKQANTALQEGEKGYREMKEVLDLKEELIKKLYLMRSQQNTGAALFVGANNSAIENWLLKKTSDLSGNSPSFSPFYGSIPKNNIVLRKEVIQEVVQKKNSATTTASKGSVVVPPPAPKFSNAAAAAA